MYQTCRTFSRGSSPFQTVNLTFPTNLSLCSKIYLFTKKKLWCDGYAGLLHHHIQWNFLCLWCFVTRTIYCLNCISPKRGLYRPQNRWHTANWIYVWNWIIWVNERESAHTKQSNASIVLGLQNKSGSGRENSMATNIKITR